MNLFLYEFLIEVLLNDTQLSFVIGAGGGREGNTGIEELHVACCRRDDLWGHLQLSFLFQKGSRSSDEHTVVLLNQIYHNKHSSAKIPLKKHSSTIAQEVQNRSIKSQKEACHFFHILHINSKLLKYDFSGLPHHWEREADSYCSVFYSLRSKL
jgi:hypothetical protein